MFAGIAAFIALQWDTMNSAARVIITLGPGIAACALAVLSSRDVRFDKAVAPLFLIAAVLEPTGLMVAFNEFGSGGDARWAALTTAGVVALQFAAIFSVLRQSMLLFLTVFFATLFWWTTFDLLNMDNEVGALVLGSSLLLAAVGVDRTPHSVITPSWYFFGAIGFFYGLFDLVERTPFEILFIVAASGFVYLSAAIQSRTLLLVVDSRDPRLHRLVHKRALRRFSRLAAGAHAVRHADDRPQRAGLPNRSAIHPKPVMACRVRRDGYIARRHPAHRIIYRG